MSDIAKRIEMLSEKRRELMHLLLAEKNKSRSQQIPRRAIQDHIPLSFAQQRVWFFDQLVPQSPLYNVPEAVRLTGALDSDALERSINAVIQRQEALRTTFSDIDGQPYQVISPDLWLPLPVVELRPLAAEEREATLQRLVAEESQRPFDLARGPLLRTTLIRLADEEQVLVLVMHHIVSDAWSKGVLLREIASLYVGFSSGSPSPLPELPIQYADFACWQRAWLQGAAPEAQLAYWRQQLGGKLPVLELPSDHPRAAHQTLRGARHTFALPAALVQALSALSRDQEFTLFMILLAALKTLLSRYTGQDDMIVGTPIASRSRFEVEGLIGFFANTLALRTRMSMDMSFRALLDRVRDVTLQAYDHQDAPFERLVEELQPDRTLSYAPLFQIMFVYENAPLEIPQLPGLTLSPVWSDTGAAKYDITLTISESAQGLNCAIEYNIDLFELATIERMAGHLQRILEAAAADPDRRLLELPLLTAAERGQMLTAWNDTRTPYPAHVCINELIEAHARQRPHAVAVVSGETQLTYADLNRRANQLARYLVRAGVGPDVRVAICVERSIEMAVGLLGIVKAGGAYVPLDPAYPQDRLAFMIDDSNVPALLTQQRLAAKIARDSVQIVCLDSDWPIIAPEPANDLPGRAGPTNLFYVIYTSGSTGRPKGVMLDHRGRVNNFYDFNTRFEIGSGDKILALSSLSFDMSAYDIFGTLAAGGAIILPLPDGERDPAHWADLILRHGVTIWHSAPALLQMLVEYVDERPSYTPRSLRLALLGGDWIPVTLPDRLKALAADVQVISLGGATESSMDSTIYAIERTDPAWKSIPYGRPMANQRSYILDAALHPVPIGIAGELHLAGVGLAWGYLNRPDLTAEKFIPSPLPEEPGLRLYKTGDLARYRPDSTIELLGRMDYQVKIRGLRIELGEIEAVMRRHRAVHKCIVVARADTSGAKQLAAYVVLHEPRAAIADELRGWLKERLPDYMVPASFTVLDALPVTPNGKINRRGLPAPDQAGGAACADGVAPRDDLERRLALIWESMLERRPISIGDNFFDLGGHSLLAVRVIAQIRKEFQIDLPLITMFRGPTIEQLSRIVRQQASIPSPSVLVGLQPDGPRPPLFCVHPLGGSVFCYNTLARYLGDDQPLYGLQSVGLDGEAEPHTHLDVMAADYIRIVRAIQPRGPYFLGGWSFGGVVAFEMAQQLLRAGEQAGLLALFDTDALFLDAELREFDGAQALVDLVTANIPFNKEQLPLSYEHLRGLDLPEQIHYVFEQLQRNHLAPPGIEIVEAQRIAQVCLGNLQAQRGYRAEVYPGPITLLRARDIHPKDVIDTAYRRFRLEQEALGWDKLSSGPVNVVVVPGDHRSIIQEPHVQDLAKALRACLDQAQPARP